jgi:hypothetical protein
MSRVAEAYFANGRVNPLLPFLPGKLGLRFEIQPEANIFLKIEPWQQSRILKRDREARMDAGQNTIGDLHAATARRLQASENAKKAGLAGPAGSKDSNHLPRAKLKAEIAKHRLSIARIVQRYVTRNERPWNIVRHAALFLC